MILEEIARRSILMQTCIKNSTLIEIELSACKQDILYWFKNYAWTDKNDSLYPKEYPTVIPFMPYPFQEECIVEVWDSIIK